VSPKGAAPKGPSAGAKPGAVIHIFQGGSIQSLTDVAFSEGTAEHSGRPGFPYWNANVLYGIKWGNFKVAMMEQMYLTSPATTLPTSHIVNMVVGPKKRKALDYPYVHSWVATHAYEVVAAFKESVEREPLIPLGAPLDFVPHAEPA
jgi:hypothetical protein